MGGGEWISNQKLCKRSITSTYWSAIELIRYIQDIHGYSTFFSLHPLLSVILPEPTNSNNSMAVYPLQLKSSCRSIWFISCLNLGDGEDVFSFGRHILYQTLRERLISYRCNAQIVRPIQASPNKSNSPLRIATPIPDLHGFRSLLSGSDVSLYCGITFLM